MKKSNWLLLFFLFLQLVSIISKQGLSEVNNRSIEGQNISEKELKTKKPMKGIKQTKSWTFMVYMAGDNDLEEVAITDLNELEYGLNQSGLAEEMNIIVVFDRHPNYDSSNGNWIGTRYYEVIPDDALDGNIDSTLVGPSLGEQNMGNPNTLTNFVNWTLTNYPAEHYALVFWDHGSGIDGLCYDQTDNDKLTYAEIHSALVTVNNTLNERLYFDFMGADICFGQLFEVAWQMRNFTRYYVASEAEEEWEGWSYDLSFASFEGTSPTPEEFIIAIVDGVEAFYEGEQQNYSTLSVVNCSALPTLFEALRSLDDSLIEMMDVYRDKISNALTETLIFSALYDVIDFYDFIRHLKIEIAHPTLQNQLDTISATADDVIVYEYQGSYYSSSASGIAITFPDQGDNHNLLDFGLDTHWNLMIEAFYDSETLPLISVSEPIIFYNEKMQELNITVTATLSTNETLNETNTQEALYSVMEVDGGMLDFGSLIWRNNSWVALNVDVSSYMTIETQAYSTCFFNATSNQGMGQSGPSTIFKRTIIPEFIDPPIKDIDGIFNLSWSELIVDNGSIDHYTVQWSTNEDFTDIQSVDVNATIHVFNITPTNELYYFRVQWVTTENRTYGEWSKIITIFIGGPIGPTTPIVSCFNLVGHTTFTVSWTEAIDYDGNVVSYVLQHAQDSEFTVNSVEIIVNSTSQTFGILEDGVYYFRVRAVDNEGFTSDWSIVKNVEVMPMKPSKPIFTTATPSYIDEKRVFMIYWTQAIDFDGIVIGYHLQQALDMNFTLNLISYNTTVTNQNIPVLPLGIYYYRVRSVDNEGFSSDWSNFHQIIVNYPNVPPNSPEFISLATLYHENNISIYWTSSTDSDGSVIYYLLEVSGSANFTSSIVYKTIATSIILEGKEIGYGTKHIRISAIDDAGNYSEWENGSCHINRLPMLPSILYVNEKTVTGQDLSNFMEDITNLESIKITLDPDIDYDGSISTYEVEIDTNANFASSRIVSIYTEICSIQDLITSIEYKTTYYIRIRAIDNNGGFSNWSVIYYFTTPTTPFSNTNRNGGGVSGFGILVFSLTITIITYYLKKETNNR